MRALQFSDIRRSRGPRLGGGSRAARRPRADPDRCAGREREPDRLEDVRRIAGRRRAAGRARAIWGSTLPVWWTRSARESRASPWAMTCSARASNTQAEFAVLDSWAAKPRPSTGRSPRRPAWPVRRANGVFACSASRAGDTIFVDGGAGGVGAAAVQMAVARGANVIASSGEANQDYLREIGAIPVLYGDGVVDRVRGRGRRAGSTAVFDVVGKTPIEDLISLASEPSEVVTIANFGAGDGRCPRHRRRTRRAIPCEALAGVADLLDAEQTRDQGADFPVRARGRGLPHQSGRPRPRQAGPSCLTEEDDRERVLVGGRSLPGAVRRVVRARRHRAREGLLRVRRRRAGRSWTSPPDR